MFFNISEGDYVIIKDKNKLEIIKNNSEFQIGALFVYK